MLPVLLFLCLQGSPDYYLDRQQIPLNDILDTGGRIYVRARTLKEPLRLIWRETVDGRAVGVHRDRFGGAVFPLGNGKDAVIHSKSLYFSLHALEQNLGITIQQGKGRTTLQSGGKKAPPPKRTLLVPGDRMIDLKFPLLKNPGRVDSLSKKRKGKRILLFAWAPWNLSRESLSEWQDLYRRLRRYDLVVIGISMDAGSGDRSKQHLPKGVTFPILHDREWRFLQTVEREALPFWLLIDEWGFVRAEGTEVDEAAGALAKLQKPQGGRIRAWVPDEGQEPLPGSRWEAVRNASSLWKGGKQEEGVVVLARYLRKNEGDLLLRHQKWSFEFPAQMHGEALDPGWLEAQEKRERTGG